MARFYSNENFPFPVVEELRHLGHDVLTIQETGKAQQAMSDEAVLFFAIEKKRTILTLNRKHFIRLHRNYQEHTGIIVCSFDPDFIGQAHQIHASVELQRTLSGQLIRINRLPK